MPAFCGSHPGLPGQFRQWQEGVSRRQQAYSTDMPAPPDVLHHFMKQTQKTPKREIDTARRRFEEAKRTLATRKQELFEQEMGRERREASGGLQKKGGINERG